MSMDLKKGGYKIKGYAIKTVSLYIKIAYPEGLETIPQTLWLNTHYYGLLIQRRDTFPGGKFYHLIQESYNR